MPTLNKLISETIAAADIGADYAHAHIEFEGVDRSGSSHEGRVFVNNPDADGETDRTAENGYAGSFYVFGHGGCYGDQGHCDVLPRGPYDPRPPHNLLPVKKVVPATEAIRAAGDEVRVTVVPILSETTDKVPDDEQLPVFSLMSVITYR
jgi:hypothetical protein